jgi:hypothetical protein
VSRAPRVSSATGCAWSASHARALVGCCWPPQLPMGTTLGSVSIEGTDHLGRIPLGGDIGRRVPRRTEAVRSVQSDQQARKLHGASNRPSRREGKLGAFWRKCMSGTCTGRRRKEVRMAACRISGYPERCPSLPALQHSPLSRPHLRPLARLCLETSLNGRH